MRGWWNLVDTRDLKSLGLTVVRVQVPLCAPVKKQIVTVCFFTFLVLL